MQLLTDFLYKIGITKSQFAKLLGVSRQMLYHYLSMDKFEDLPIDKQEKILQVLKISKLDDLKEVAVDDDYYLHLHVNKGKINPKKITRLRISNKSPEVLRKVKKLLDYDNNRAMYLNYVLDLLEREENLKYLIAYFAKLHGIMEENQYDFDEDKQYLFETIMYYGLTMYENKKKGKTNLSKEKLSGIRRRFLDEIAVRKQSDFSKTSEINTLKIQALAELGYEDINVTNAKEVMDKIAEIENRTKGY